MELLYIYIYENGKNISHQGINLSSKQFIQTEILAENKETGEINLKLSLYPDFQNKGLNNFYSDNISNLRLLIGENGSGKSSVLNEIVDSLIGSKGGKYEGFIVTDKYIICRNPLIKFEKSSLEKDFQNHSIIRNLDIIRKNRPSFSSKKELSEFEAMGYKATLLPDYVNDTSVVCISNHLNLSEISSDGYTLYGNSSGREIDYMYYHDFTIANKIAKDQQSYITGLNSSLLPDGIMAYKIREFQRVVDLLLDDTFREFLPDPKRFQDLDVDLEFDSNIEDFFTKAFTFNEDEEIPIVDDLHLIESEFYKKGKEEKFEFNLVKNVFYSVLSITYGELLRSRNTEKTKETIILDYYNYKKEGKMDFETFQNYFKSSKLIKEYVPDLDGLINKVISFFKNNYSGVNVYSDYLTFRISQDSFWTKYSEFIESNEMRSHFKRDTPYFISPLKPALPELSEGEKNLISIFSNMRELKQALKRPESKNIKNLIILMDEPDRGIHPEWQRTFLNTFINLLKYTFKEYKCQLVATSHSPFFTSDIPDLDISFLKRIEGESQVEEIRDIKTFGANIHDLYSDSFYMNNGFVGEFAKNKILKLIEYYAGKNNEFDEKSSIDLISIIGDEIISSRLRDMHNEKFNVVSELKDTDYEEWLLSELNRIHS